MNHNPVGAVREPPQFDLGADETFVIVEWPHQGKTRQGRHYFAQPSSDIAEQYLKNMQSSQRALDGNIIETEFDSTEADLTLWRQLCRRVEGYVTRDGDFMSQPNWQELVPAPHKQAAAQGIFFLGMDTDGQAEGEDDGTTFDPVVEVRLTAMQNGELIKGLVHLFRYPKPSELKEWNQIHSSSRVELRAKERRYLFENSIRREIKFYDSMVVGCQGYVYRGEPVGAVREPPLLDPPGVLQKRPTDVMNPVHKQRAIERAFAVVRQQEATPTGPLEPMPSANASAS